MYILGLNAYHGDSSACIFFDGKIVAAIEEERLRRIKHWAGFPSEAIKFCLEECNISIKDIDHITLSRDPRANFGKKIKHTIKNNFSMSAVIDRLSNYGKIDSVKSILAKEFDIEVRDIKAEVHQLEHHRTHLASAFFASEFEEAAVISIDGFGDFSSTMIGVGKGNEIKVFHQVNYPHSLGIFYTAFTQFLGFPYYGDEYKVMGLAPYGNENPALLEKVRDVVILKEDGLFELNLDYFTHSKDGVAMSWEGGSPDIKAIYSSYMVDVFGSSRRGSDDSVCEFHKDLAAAVQTVAEEVIFHVAEALHVRTGLKDICIAGGCAQNSVANGKLLSSTSFENLYVAPAGHDAGTAIGGALWLYHHILENPRKSSMQHSYFGSQFTEDEVLLAVDKTQFNFQIYDEATLDNLVVDSMINGGVVGWFQGRAEFGPRALGNRSIIADPTREDAKELLNLKIKRREKFRPFAPSILEEHVSDYFEETLGSPFMERVLKIKQSKRSILKAVTHVDGTGRLQTVSKETNPRYHSLINAFYKKTGVPILLNTSFNENEPIVNSPDEALACFGRTKMDILVMGNVFITK
jgi:carbamoyltransferase|tara:strand:- start:3017 stop:4750 length:1734 start_codon:yes stop_codon:yes gene_type:complete